MRACAGGTKSSSAPPWARCSCLWPDGSTGPPAVRRRPSFVRLAVLMWHHVPAAPASPLGVVEDGCAVPASNGGGGDVGEAEAAELGLGALLAPSCLRPRRHGLLLALFRRCGLPLAARARSDGRRLAVERSGGLLLDVRRGGDDLLVAVKWLSEILSWLMFVSWSGSLASSSSCSVVASSVARVLRSRRLVVEGIRVGVDHDVRQLVGLTEQSVLRTKES